MTQEEIEEWCFRSPIAIKSYIITGMLNEAIDWEYGYSLLDEINKQEKEGTFKIEDWVE